MSEERLLSIEGACRYLGITRHTLRRLRLEARPPIPHLRVGSRVRFVREEIERWAREAAARTEGGSAAYPAASREGSPDAAAARRAPPDGGSIELKGKTATKSG